MAKEVSHTEPKPKNVQKIAFVDETGNGSTEFKQQSKPMTTAVTISNQLHDGKPIKKTYEQMIIDAITENDPRRKGISFVFIKKFIKGKYQIDGEISLYVKKAFEKLTEKDAVERVSGMSGINGSIRLTKAHIKSVQKQQKISKEPKSKKHKAAKKSAKIQSKKDNKDANNNKEKKGKAGKAKPKPHVKLSTKKTSITKTKIANSGGKVRLSIVTGMDPQPSTSTKKAKAKTNASKTKAATVKLAKTKGQKKVSAKPKSVLSEEE